MAFTPKGGVTPTPPTSGGSKDIPWGPIITAGAGLAGDYLNYRGQQQTNTANAQQAKAAMDFEERMSNTAYQRGKADLEKAGYNPALAYGKGGADTPSGKTAEMKNSLAAFGGSAAAAAETFNNIQRTQADVQKTKAETQLTTANANQINLESAARAAEMEARAARAGSDARFAEKTFADRVDIVDSDKLYQQYRQRGEQVNLERNTKSFERERDVLWPLAIEQLKQDLAHTVANTRGANANARLSELEIPTAENMARAAQTRWGKNISPFLSDASKLANMISVGAGAGIVAGTVKGAMRGAAKGKPMSVDWDNVITQPPRNRR